MLNHTDDLPKDPMLTNNYSRFFGKENILFSEGKEWKKSRKIITTSFNFDFIKRSIPKIIWTTEEKLQSIKNQKDVDTLILLEKVAAQTIMRVLFEGDFAEKIYKGKALSQWIVEIMAELHEQTNEFYYILFGEKFFKLGLRASDRKLNRNIRNIRSIFVNYIKEQQLNKSKVSSETTTNLLSLLLKNEETLNGNLNEEISERITNELMVIFFAGTDTTSNLMNNTLYLLSTKLDVLNKLVNEIETNIKNENTMDFDLISKLDYLSAVLKESLRMYGPGLLLFNRIAKKSFRIGDFIIKKNTIVQCPQMSNSLETMFFLILLILNQKDGLNKIDPYLYVPFSG